jgi:large subunit ribosomal protein L4
MKADLYTQTGEKKGQVELKKEFFEVPYNRDLIHQAIVRQQANARAPFAHTLQRGEVNATNKKPHRQKGTGYARQGSRVGPHMRGGGIVFGPRKERNYTVAMPKKQRRKALFSALSVKAKDNQIMALEGYEGDVKTKSFAEMIAKLPIERNVLVVIPEKNEVIQRSSNNLPNVKTILVGYLNIADLQKYRNVLFLKDALTKMEEVFQSEQGAAKAKPSGAKRSDTILRNK